MGWKTTSRWQPSLCPHYRWSRTYSLLYSSYFNYTAWTHQTELWKSSLTANVISFGNVTRLRLRNTFHAAACTIQSRILKWMRRTTLFPPDRMLPVPACCRFRIYMFLYTNYPTSCSCVPALKGWTKEVFKGEVRCMVCVAERNATFIHV